MRLQLSAFFDPVARRLRFAPWRRRLQWVWQTTVYTGLALLGLAVLAWLTLQWGILPHIEDWRPAIERHASQAIGVRVRIGRIDLRSSGWVPALELRDVVLSDASGIEALRLPRVSAALSPRSLLALEPRLTQLYVEDARLLVRRDAQGHLHVGGLDVAAPGASVASQDENGALDWLFRQQELVLRHGALRWIDEQRGAPALELSDVDIVVRNGLRSHDVRIDATPPADWGDRFSLRLRSRQPLFARAGDWQRWTGTVYADLPRGDVAQLKRHVDLPVEIDRGSGSLRLWLDFKGPQWRAVTADVQLDQVALRLAADVEPLSIAHAGGRLGARRDAAGVSLSADHFGFATSAGLVWPPGNLRLSWRQAQTGLAAASHRRGDASPRAPHPPAAASGVPAMPVVPGVPAVPAMPLRDADASAPVTGGRLVADHLDLALMRRLSAALPLPAPVRQWLADYQPEGDVSGLSARWSGAAQAPDTYHVKASVVHFSLAAAPPSVGARLGRPGWRNATVNLEASETGGAAQVGLDGGAIDVPGVFEQPVVAFDRFGANVSWTIDRHRDAARPSAVAVTWRDVDFANADAQGRFQMQWHTGAGPAGVAGRGLRFPGDIDLSGVLVRARADKLARYLPLGVPKSTRSYLQAAFTSGELSAVDFKVRGDLAGFPYQRLRDGDFRIAGHVACLDLAYVPGTSEADGTRAASAWPVFTQVQGDVVYDRSTLEIHRAQARVGAVSGAVLLQGVQGGVDTMPLHGGPTLALQGRATGPLPEFLRYVSESPVGGWLHGGLARATATGDANLDLTLAIPLRDAAGSTVHGVLTLADDNLRLVPESPLLSAAHARIDFTEHGMKIDDGGAVLLGGPASFDGLSQPDGSLHFTVQGTATAEGLQRESHDIQGRLTRKLSGQSAYKLQIGIAKGQTEFAFSSPLTGLAIAMPAPLNKPAEAIWPLRASSVVTFDAEGRPHDTVRVVLAPPQGGALQAEVVRDLGGPVPRPERAAYAIGAPLPASLPGGLLVLQGARFDGDAWLAFWQGLSAPGASSGPVSSAASAGSAAWATSASSGFSASSVPPAGTAVRDAGKPVPDSGYAPMAAAIRLQDLVLGGRHLGHADIKLAQVITNGEEVWRANASSDQTTGVVEYRPDTPSRGAQLFARLDRLALDSHDPEVVPEVAPAADLAAPASQSPAATVPALDIVVDSFELNGKKLGKLQVAATLQPGGRDWRLTRLSLATPEATFAGTGRWSGAPARRMSLDFTLALADSGALLERLGMGRVIKHGQGRLSGALNWTGSPLAIDYPSLQGKLQLALDAGQFLKADAGAGRLLGVLSLQSLPRRLTLDFRDVFQEGFAFDNVTGDVDIANGVASTRDFRMRGLNAAVLMSGRADLKAETQDLDVIIVPEVNAGAASLAYAAINPVIGLGTFLAQLFLKSPLTEAGTRELHVSGTWSKPRVDQVEHQAAVAAAAQAASQARAAESAAHPASAP